MIPKLIFGVSAVFLQNLHTFGIWETLVAIVIDTCLEELHVFLCHLEEEKFQKIMKYKLDQMINLLKFYKYLDNNH